MSRVTRLRLHSWPLCQTRRPYFSRPRRCGAFLLSRCCEQMRGQNTPPSRHKYSADADSPSSKPGRQSSTWTQKGAVRAFLSRCDPGHLHAQTYRRCLSSPQPLGAAQSHCVPTACGNRQTNTQTNPYNKLCLVNMRRSAHICRLRMFPTFDLCSDERQLGGNSLGVKVLTRTHNSWCANCRRVVQRTCSTRFRTATLRWRLRCGECSWQITSGTTT